MEEAAWKALQAKESPFDLAAPPSKHYMLGTRSLEILLVAVQEMRSVAMNQLGCAKHYHKPKSKTYTEKQLRGIQKASGYQASDHMLLKLNKFMHMHMADFELMTRRDSERKDQDGDEISLIIPVPLNVGGTKCEVMSATLLGTSEYHSQFFSDIMFLTPSALTIEGGTVALSSERGSRIFQALKGGNCVGSDKIGQRYFETVPKRADKHYFVDRSGELFEHVLAFMRDHALMEPPGGLSDNLLARLRLEAEYFQIPAMSTVVNNILKMRNLGLEKDAMAELVQKNKYKLAELLEGHQSAMHTMYSAHEGEIENARHDVEQFKIAAKEAENKVSELKQEYAQRAKAAAGEKGEDDDKKRRGSRRSLGGSTDGDAGSAAAATAAAAVVHAVKTYKGSGQRYSSDTASRWATVAAAVKGRGDKQSADKLSDDQLVEFAAELLTEKIKADAAANKAAIKRPVMSEFIEEFVYSKYSPSKARSFLQSVHISLADVWVAPPEGTEGTAPHARHSMLKVLALMLGIATEGHPTLGGGSLQWHSDYMPEVAVEIVTRAVLTGTLADGSSKLEDETTWQQLNQELGGAKPCSVSRPRMLAALAGDEKAGLAGEKPGAGAKRDSWTGRFVTFLSTPEQVDSFIAAADKQLIWEGDGTSLDGLLLLALEHTAAEASRRYAELVEVFATTVDGGASASSMSSPEQQATWAWEVDLQQLKTILRNCSIGIGRSFFSKSAQEPIDPASATLRRLFRELLILADEKDCVTPAVFAAFCHRQEVYVLPKEVSKPAAPTKKGK
jgi:hypothetical protein